MPRYKWVSSDTVFVRIKAISDEGTVYRWVNPRHIVEFCPIDDPEEQARCEIRTTYGPGGNIYSPDTIDAILEKICEAE